MLGLVGKILNRGAHGTLHQATKKTGTHARANAIALRSQRQLHETAKRRSPEPLKTTPRGVSSSTCFLIYTPVFVNPDVNRALASSGKLPHATHETELAKCSQHHARKPGARTRRDAGTGRPTRQPRLGSRQNCTLPAASAAASVCRRSSGQRSSVSSPRFGRARARRAQWDGQAPVLRCLHERRQRADHDLWENSDSDEPTTACAGRARGFFWWDAAGSRLNKRASAVPSPPRAVVSVLRRRAVTTVSQQVRQ